MFASLLTEGAILKVGELHEAQKLMSSFEHTEAIPIINVSYLTSSFSLIYSIFM